MLGLIYKMKAFISTFAGLVDFLEKEMLPFCNILSKEEKGLFVDANIEEIYSIIFNSHFAHEVLLYLGYVNNNSFILDIDDTTKEFLLNIGKQRKATLRVSGKTDHIHEFSKSILYSLSKIFDFKVNLDDPLYDILILENTQNREKQQIIGIRFYHNLQKRDYRIQGHKQAINASIAFALSFGLDGNMLDPYTKDGVIAIERSLYQNNKLRYYQTKDIIS